MTTDAMSPQTACHTEFALRDVAQPPDCELSLPIRVRERPTRPAERKYLIDLLSVSLSVTCPSITK
jgi:hypothetical protein